MSSFIEVTGASFYVEIAGSGQALVLVHAGIADGRMWDDQLPVFAERYRTLRYDRRGFGRTKMAAGSYSHHGDLQGLLQAAGMERVHLVGCSQGAKTVLDFALEHPEMTASLVLVSPAVSGFVYRGEPPRQAAELEAAEEAGDLERVNELELQIWVDGPQRTAEQLDDRLREKVREMNGIALGTPEDLGSEQMLEPPAVGRLAEIGVPTLVLNGDLDTPWTLAAADYLVNTIPGVQQAVLAGTAHLPNMEKPAEFNEVVLTFLASLG